MSYSRGVNITFFAVGKEWKLNPTQCMVDGLQITQLP